MIHDIRNLDRIHEQINAAAVMDDGIGLDHGVMNNVRSTNVQQPTNPVAHGQHRRSVAGGAQVKGNIAAFVGMGSACIVNGVHKRFACHGGGAVYPDAINQIVTGAQCNARSGQFARHRVDVCDGMQPRIKSNDAFGQLVLDPCCGAGFGPIDGDKGRACF